VFKKSLLCLCSSVALILGMGLIASPAEAAPGDEFIVNGDFSDYDPATGAITDGVTTTDFSLTTSLAEASSPGNGDMYDPGVYAVSTNAGALHNQWIEQAGDNPKMVLNGFTEGVQTVWQQTADGVTCDTPGSTIGFEFTADVANVLPLDQYSDGGANISVYINDQLIGSADLTSNDGTPVSISSAMVPAADAFVIEVRNSATVYVGNDFSLDNLSLVQTGDCTAPVAVLFDVAPTDPTCEADGSLDTSLFPIVREGYTLTVDRAFDGPGDYVITATAADGFFFSGDGDPFVRSVTVTVGERLPAAECRVGGLTIGYYKNHAVSEATWDAARAGLNTLFGAYPNWNNALAVLNAKPTNDGSVQLLRQAIAFALNVETIDGFAENIMPNGMTAEAYLDYLNATPTAWDTRSERLAIAAILDAANQHVV
jgi:hypothetical protein